MSQKATGSRSAIEARSATTSGLDTAAALAQTARVKRGMVRRILKRSVYFVQVTLEDELMMSLYTVLPPSLIYLFLSFTKLDRPTHNVNERTRHTRLEGY